LVSNGLEGSAMTDHITPEASAAHWAKTRTLMWTCLVIWAVFAFAIHMFVGVMNGVTFIGFPLGFYMASQGSLVVFVVLIFWYASRQNAIDEEFGAAED
jgi:putative solute:sodium symporter small subunit